MPISSGGLKRLISLKDVERLTSLKKSSIYSLIAKGRFPRPVKVSVRRVAWLASEVQTWIATRLDARSTVGFLVGEAR